MVQYYVIANLDKKEFLSPRTFHEDIRFTGFSTGSAGTMTAVAILTSEGGGRGTGDLYRLAFSDQGVANFRAGEFERVGAACLVDYNSHGDTLPSGNYQTMRTIVPKLAGTWAGDRIVTVGDYSAPGKHLTRTQELQIMYQDWQIQLSDALRDKQQHTIITQDIQNQVATQLAETKETNCNAPFDNNLYYFAARYFKDISESINGSMLQFGLGYHSQASLDAKVTKLLGCRLQQSYTHKITPVGGVDAVAKWKLEWMTARMLESLICKCADRTELNHVKKWLRKQILLPWQREVLKCYQFDKAGNEKINDRKIDRILREAGIANDQNRYPYRFPPILPDADILEAAMEIQHNRDNSAIASQAVTGTATLSQLAHTIATIARLAPGDSRVIDLDGDGTGTGTGTGV